jgi:endo-1,4-beta-xylanase
MAGVRAVAATIAALGTLLIGVDGPSRAIAANEPAVSVGDATLVEGTAASRSMQVAVTLDRPATATVVVTYRLRASSATAPSDFDDKGGVSRTISFVPGATVSKFIAVVIRPDTVDESDETFVIDLLGATNATISRSVGLGTIVDDDPIGPGFRATVSDASIVEGDLNQRKLRFTVSLSEPAPATVGMQYTISQLSATNGADHTATPLPRTLTFRRGASGFTPVAKIVTVPVNSDVVAEGDETFRIVLSQPTVGVLLVDSVGIGRIIDDDGARDPLIGAAISWPQVALDDDYANLATRHFDIVTPENALKWDALRPSATTYNFVVADALVGFARDRGQTVHGHTLLWHSQNPAWLTNGVFSRAELIVILTDHIATVVGRYRGQVQMWDVANEVIADNGQLRPNLWLTGIGPDYLDIAFAAARLADPQARLYINDYSIEHDGPKADGLHDLVSDLVARGVPVDGVGFQSHLLAGEVTETHLRAEFDRYTALGLDVAITELDVRLPVPASSSALAQQATTYAEVVTACTNTPRCESITTWGITDRYSWIPSWFVGWGAALPWDENYVAKPALAPLSSLIRNP